MASVKVRGHAAELAVRCPPNDILRIGMEESKENLELRLLRAQIKKTEKDASWLASINAIATGVLTSLIASIAIGTLAFLLGAQWIDSLLQKKQQIEAEITTLTEQYSNLRKEEASIRGAISGLSVTSTLYDQGINMKIEFLPSDNPAISMVKVSSSSPKTTFKAFDACPGKFAFPGGGPTFGSKNCKELPKDRSRCDTSASGTVCVFGPIMVISDREIGIWVVAGLEGKRAVRYVSLNP